MATLNVRVDDKLKQAAFAVFDDLGVSPSDAIRDYLAYVADNGKLPIRQVWIDETEYLLSNPANAQHLMKAVQAVKNQQLIQQQPFDD